MLGNAEAEQAISMRPDLTVLSVTIACAVLCALFFGMAPAWTASRTRVDAVTAVHIRGYLTAVPACATSSSPSNWSLAHAGCRRRST
jgi:hypothetical protein